MKNTMRLTYTGKGRKNKSINMDFIEICKLDAASLKKYLEAVLKKYYRNVISQDGFLYVKGKDKIAITAHMDTVHKELIKDFHELHENGKHIVSSPQGIGGDDRCGIYMILEILKRTKYRPTIIFCEDEEIGGVGSDKFCRTNFIKNLEKMYFMIELDRRGNDDLVFYEDDNREFVKFCERATYYSENWGTFSDISNLAPAAGVSAVNISCGYHNEHSTDEYVVLEEMEQSIKTTIELIKKGLRNKTQFEYKEKFINYRNGYYFDDEEYYFSNKKDIVLWVMFDSKEDAGEDYFRGSSEEEVFYNFFMAHPTVSYNDIHDYELWDANELNDVI